MAWIDGALYPDVPVPESLDSLAEQIDFIARLCGAWDFGVLPDANTFAEVCRPEWSAAVDACALLTSPTYHLLRERHGLPAQPFLGASPAYILEDPFLDRV